MTGVTRHLGTTFASADAASFAARGLGRLAGPTNSPAWDLARQAEQLVQVKLAEDISGPTNASQWLEATCRTESVVALARGMYEARDFAPMPVLADALEDAGCAEPDILAHCRGAGPHVRGCWVVDLVLGKR
jgi:hypothetical protein